MTPVLEMWKLRLRKPSDMQSRGSKIQTRPLLMVDKGTNAISQAMTLLLVQPLN